MSLLWDWEICGACGHYWAAHEWDGHVGRRPCAYANLEAGEREPMLCTCLDFREAYLMRGVRNSTK